MATLKELQEQRENLFIQIAVVTHDLIEFTKCPCETVDIEQIKHQYSFILREIKQVDNCIKIILTSQLQTLHTDYKNLETLLQVEQSKIKFDSSYLPKNHYSLWENSK